MFPAGPVPDGNVLAPHHYTWGMLAAALVFFIIWDDYRRREPIVIAFATVTGLFSFIFIWPIYHVTGAAIALAAPVVMAAAALYRLVGERAYPWYWLVLILLFALVALDDAVEHAFHVWSPLDWAWNVLLRPALPST